MAPLCPLFGVDHLPRIIQSRIETVFGSGPRLVPPDSAIISLRSPEMSGAPTRRPSNQAPRPGRAVWKPSNPQPLGALHMAHVCHRNICSGVLSTFARLGLAYRLQFSQQHDNLRTEWARRCSFSALNNCYRTLSLNLSERLMTWAAGGNPSTVVLSLAILFLALTGLVPGALPNASPPSAVFRTLCERNDPGCFLGKPSVSRSVQTPDSMGATCEKSHAEVGRGYGAAALPFPLSVSLTLLVHLSGLPF